MFRRGAGSWFFNEPSFLAGIENLPRAIETVVAAGPDAIQLTVGQAPHLQKLPVRGKPALVLRTDVANVYGTTLPGTLFSRIIEDAALQAVRLDAACVVVNLFRIPEQPDVTVQCIQNILRLKPQCDHYGMPLMIEPLVFQPNVKAGGYMVDGDPEKIIPLVRQAVELGADIIKADPTNDPSIYHQVIQTAGGIPVLVRGGKQSSGGGDSDEDIRSARTRRGRHRLWSQHHSAPEPGGHYSRVDGRRARKCLGRSGDEISGVKIAPRVRYPEACSA